ncbi:hypothetical protein JHE03_24275 [Pluralibacter gergoviae]|nr:hypothetical protein [Pluralibacter gergoviae]MBK4119398.1 hypothetical protein [Pluralibacter gergoviae]
MMQVPSNSLTLLD